MRKVVTFIRTPNSAFRISEPPSAQSLYRAPQSLALLLPLGEGEQSNIGLNRQVECLTIVSGRGERGGVVGQVRASELVSGKALGDLSPAAHTCAEIALGQGPEVPCTSMHRIGRDGAGGELRDVLGSAARKPVGVGENHQCTRVVRPGGNNVLVCRAGDLGHCPERLDRGREDVGIGRAGDVLDALEQVGDVRVLPIGIDGGGDLGVNVGARH